MTVENQITAKAVQKTSTDTFLASKVSHHSEAIKMAAILFFGSENEIISLEYFDLSNGGFYFKPANFQTSIVSEDMFGIILTDLVLNHVYGDTKDNGILSLIKKLNDFHDQKIIEEQDGDSSSNDLIMH